MHLLEYAKTRFQHFFQIRYIYHYLFWITHIMVIVSSSWGVIPDMKFDWVSAQVFQMLLVIGMFYINIRFFIVKYYRQKRFLPYILLSLLTMSVAGFLYAFYVHLFTKMPYDMFQMDQIAEVHIRMSRLYITSFFLGLTDDWVAQQKRLSDMKVEKLKAELSYLRSQINPHFLFNTLNNLYSMALEKSDNTPVYILKLSAMMDYMLFESSAEKVPLAEDLKNLSNYVEIERIRHVEPAKIQFNTEGVVGEKKIAPLLLLPLVENAFKHGLNRSILDSFVKINILITEGELSCRVENNLNTTIYNNDIEKNHGIGLLNLQRRLDLYYPEKHQLITTKTDVSFIVLLKLNLT